MEYTEEQKAEFKRQYAAKKRRQIFVAIPIVAVVLLLIVSEGKDAILGLPLNVAGPLFIALIFGALIFSFFNWRCPACRKYLGKTINHKFCAACGVGLS